VRKMVIQQLEQDFDKEILASTLPILAYFQSEWCSSCKGLAPIVEKLSDYYADRVTFIKVDTLASISLAAHHSVLSTPTIILFREGKEITRNIGFISEQNLKTLIEKSL